MPGLLVVAAAASLPFFVSVLHGAPPLVEGVTWRSGSVELHGTLYVPEDSGRRPAVVLVPGNEEGSRSDSFLREHAEHLASSGLAVLLYDPRGSGLSTGDRRKASLAELAEDALGGLRLLRSRPDVRREAVGLLGTGQGAAVAVLAASADESVAFVITLSLCLRSAAEHDTFLAGEQVRRAGHGEEAGERASRLFAEVAESVRTGIRSVDLARRLAAARREPWFETSGIPAIASTPWREEAYRRLPLDLSLEPLVRRLSVPHLAVQGEEDWLVRGAEEARRLEELGRETGLDLTVVLVPGVGHAPWGDDPLPDAYRSALDAWLERAVLRERSNAAASAERPTSRAALR